MNRSRNPLMPMFLRECGRPTEYGEGWEELASKGAKLTLGQPNRPRRPTPGSVRCSDAAISSQARGEIIFEPTGKIAAQITPPDNVLADELDLGYAILPWSSRLQKGEALRKIYGEGMGFRCHEGEDCGLFWSNDPATTVRDMVRSVGIQEVEEEIASVRQFYKKAGLPG